MTNYAVPLTRATGRPLPSISSKWSPVFVGAFTPRPGAPDHIVVTASAVTSDPSTVGEMRFRLGAATTPAWPIYSTPALSKIIGQLPHGAAAALVTIEMRRLVGAGDLVMPVAAALVTDAVSAPVPPAVVFPLVIDTFTVTPQLLNVGDPVAITLEVSGSGDLTGQLERRLPGTSTWTTDGEPFPLVAGVETILTDTVDQAGEHGYRLVINSDVLEPITSPTATVIATEVPVSAPGAPNNYRFDQYFTTSTSVSFRWDTPLTTPGNPTADRYTIRHRLKDSGPWTETDVAISPEFGNTSINSAGEQPGETWEYQLRFGNDVGDGPWSPSVDFTYPDVDRTGRILINSRGDYLLWNNRGGFVLWEGDEAPPTGGLVV